MALTGLTIFRARDGITDLDELIRNRDSLPYEYFHLNDGSIALIYYKQTSVRAPRWASFLEHIIDTRKLRSQSASAVIAIQRNGIFYLATFGYGRYLINTDLVEPAFGLKVTLNSVDPEHIRSIDKKRVDTVSRLAREQLSRHARMGVFGLDIYQDLLSAVTGKPTDGRLGNRIYGKDAVGLQVELAPEDLGDLVDLLEEIYARDGYRAKFPWVDRIREVTDRRLIDALDQTLVRRLRRDGSHNFELSPPEIVDWSIAYGFVFRSHDDPNPDLEISRYFEEIRQPGSITLENLKRDAIELVDGNGQRIGRWSVYRCLTGELTYKGQLYVLSDRKWYRILRDFVQEVNDFVAERNRHEVDLPPFRASDRDEMAYNTRVAGESGGNLVCLDRQFIRPRSWHDRIEFCDLLSVDRKIIHVKRYSGSATLSHLFAQGAVSIRCLLTDADFLAQVNEKLPERLRFPVDRPRPEDCHVIFAIVPAAGRHLRLPFFSRLALRNAAELIETHGVRVTYQEIVNESV